MIQRFFRISLFQSIERAVMTVPFGPRYTSRVQACAGAETTARETSAAIALRRAENFFTDMASLLRKYAGWHPSRRAAQNEDNSRMPISIWARQHESFANATMAD